jgi:hypothetical protein
MQNTAIKAAVNYLHSEYEVVYFSYHSEYN